MDACINNQHLTNALPTRYQRVTTHFPIHIYEIQRVTTRYHQIILKKYILYFFNKKVVTRGNALHSQRNQCNIKFSGGNAYGNALVTRW